MSTLLDCGHEPSEHGPHTTGYGNDSQGKTFCYECCAKMDREQMQKDGRITLYLTGNYHNGGRMYLTNWPGSLRYEAACVRRGRHNLARYRYDVWFTDEHGNRWHGVQYGDNTQLCHCKRLKH